MRRWLRRLLRRRVMPAVFRIEPCSFGTLVVSDNATIADWQRWLDIFEEVRR